MNILIFITGIGIGGTIILIIMCFFNMNSSIDYEEKIKKLENELLEVNYEKEKH